MNTLSSFRDSTDEEKRMRLKILSMTYEQRIVLNRFIDDLIDPLRICDDHFEPYIFFDATQFYCKKCVRPTTTGLQLIDFDSPNNGQIQALYNSFSQQYNPQQSALLQITPEMTNQRRQEITNLITQQQLGNQQNNLANELSEEQFLQVLQNRDRFIEIQQFISHIPLDIRNRPQHDELHINNLENLDNHIGNIGQHNQQSIQVDNWIQRFLTG